MGRGRKIVKNCTKCKKDFLAIVAKVKEGGGKFCSIPCYLQYRKDNKQDEKELNVFYQKKHKYGLSRDEYKHMIKEANGICIICNKNKKLVVDHCHDTGKTRGLICDKCNRGIGCFNDSIEALQNAINYLGSSSNG